MKCYHLLQLGRYYSVAALHYFASILSIQRSQVSIIIILFLSCHLYRGGRGVDQ